MIFTDAEYAYLAGHPLGRLATIGPDGAPMIHPVAFRLDAGGGTIHIGGPALARSQKFRNVLADPRVSLAVDDQADHHLEHRRVRAGPARTAAAPAGSRLPECTG